MCVTDLCVGAEFMLWTGCCERWNEDPPMHNHFASVATTQCSASERRWASFPFNSRMELYKWMRIACIRYECKDKVLDLYIQLASHDTERVGAFKTLPSRGRPLPLREWSFPAVVVLPDSDTLLLLICPLLPQRQHTIIYCALSSALELMDLLSCLPALPAVATF